MPAALKHTLPRAAAAFTGRGQELQLLTGARTTGTGAVALLTIHGMPGVGKTALAVRAAHLLADEFPDGQLFLSLHGHTPGRHPYEASAALASLLAAVGVKGQHIPAELDDRAAMWRDQLRGKRVLLILDDVLDMTQIEALLPGSSGCLVIVTSRRRLQAPDATVALSLDVLPVAEAAELFLRISQRGAGSKEESVASVAALCGLLPLSISLVASWLRNHPTWTLDDLAEDLRRGQHNLAVIRENESVRTAFDLSYVHLSEPQQAFFRHLAIHPGSDMDAYAAAALSELPIRATSALLEDLYNYHLIEEDRRGRYRMHDLVKQFVGELADLDPPEDRMLAQDRLIDYYILTSSVADSWITAEAHDAMLIDEDLTPVISSLSTAVNWLEDERSNIFASVDLARLRGDHRRVIGLGTAITGFLRAIGPWDQALRVHGYVADAGRAGGDLHATAVALNQMGLIWRMKDDYTRALNDLAGALDIFRSVGDRRGEAGALNEMGVVRRVLGEFDLAVEHLNNAANIFDEIDNLSGKAYVLNDLGVVRSLTGQSTEGIDLFRQSLSIFDQLQDRYGEAEALNNLGFCLRESERPSEALPEHERALQVARSIHSFLEEARGLEGRGSCLLLLDQRETAIASLRMALEIYRRIGASEARRATAELASAGDAPLT